MQEEKIREHKEKRNEAIQKDCAETARVWKARGLAAGREVLWCGWAWLLGQAGMLFETYPLGLALLCGSAKHTVAILIGLLLSAISNLRDPVVYICAYCAAALIRVIASMLLDTPDARFTLPEGLKKKLKALEPEKPTGSETSEQSETWLSRLRKRIWKTDAVEADRAGLWEETKNLFSESVCLRMATAAVCVLIISLYRIFAGGFRYYDLFAAIFSVLLTPTAAMVYSVSLEKRTRSEILKTVSEAALLFSLIYAANTVTFLSFPFAPILALFFTLFLCQSRGYVIGIAAAGLCGLAYAPLHAPAFLLAALAYCFFHRLEKENIGILSACFCTVAWSVYIDGATALLSLVPSALIAGAVFTVAQKLQLASASVREEEVETPSNGTAQETRLQMESTRYQDSNDRFRGISDAFSSLSEVFYNLSDRFRRPGTLDLRRICDDSFDRFCTDCPNKSVCWGLEYSDTLGTVNRLISALHTRGSVEREQIAEPLLHRCTRMDGILEGINRDCAHLTAEMLRNNRTEIFAMDYESAAKIINDALEEEDGEYRFDTGLEQQITDYLNDAGVRANSVTVYGSRCRKILIRGVDLDHAKVTSETLRSDLGELCGSELGRPTFEVEHNFSTMILQAKQKITVTGAQNNISADGGVSGDSLNLFSNKKDYFYALISDGRGAGKEAALTSALCSVFMEKMLRAGNRAGTSLRRLNNMIRSRSADSTRECSSTIDLLELDLMTGDASFIKSGAAPSFVIRGNVVRKLQSGTVPIGIICALDAQQTRFALWEDDIVVMISDGILQSDPECEWLTAYLTTVKDLTSEEIVYRICLHAAESETHDDCSAIALRVQRAEE